MSDDPMQRARELLTETAGSADPLRQARELLADPIRSGFVHDVARVLVSDLAAELDQARGRYARIVEALGVEHTGDTIVHVRAAKRLRAELDAARERAEKAERFIATADSEWRARAEKAERERDEEIAARDALEDALEDAFPYAYDDGTEDGEPDYHERIEYAADEIRQLRANLAAAVARAEKAEREILDVREAIRFEAALASVAPIDPAMAARLRYAIGLLTEERDARPPIPPWLAARVDGVIVGGDKDAARRIFEILAEHGAKERKEPPA